MGTAAARLKSLLASAGDERATRCRVRDAQSFNQCSRYPRSARLGPPFGDRGGSAIASWVVAVFSEVEEGPDRGLRIVGGLRIPLSEVTVRVSRSSGPGGQHANVTASRVEASFDVLASLTLSDVQRERVLARVGARVVAIAQDERSQARNRELALNRLSERLAAALAVPKRRRATHPTAASRERRLQAKRQGAERKRERRRPGEGD
jgi:ribosome-associated protein